VHKFLYPSVGFWRCGSKQQKIPSAISYNIPFYFTIIIDYDDDGGGSICVESVRLNCLQNY
jgi:hypothetical protein